MLINKRHVRYPALIALDGIEELQQIVKQKATERFAIQQEIMTVNANRSKYIAAEKVKAANNNNAATLESAIEQTVKEQVKRFNMVIH